jgi:hypothetical protein
MPIASPMRIVLLEQHFEKYSMCHPHNIYFAITNLVKAFSAPWVA